MTDRKAGDGIAGLSRRLFVLFLAMVIAGFALPSPGVGAPQPVPPSLYRELAVPSVPELLIVPSIALRAPILPIEVDPDGVLTPPADVRDVGWWKRSAKPGAKSGQTLITGHTVHTGGGVMNRLGELHPGSLVRIQTPGGIVDYRTTKVFVYTKAELAKHAEELFSQKRPDYRLVLITCTGWTGTDYTSNIIVFADEMGVRRPGTSAAEADAVAAEANPDR
ncbi:class F sortase [Marmoricola sp. RAF53]|uniref:class F sortase n=1 Tax=Marmoricola sp. RAF53 TaxID=3233059 RepID=UPI003F96D3F9